MRADARSPFFEVSGGDPSAERLLLVSDQFPPAQTAGALRWQKLARFAAERGWVLDVITRSPAFVSARDESRLAELPPGTRVFGFSPNELLLDLVEDWLEKAYRALRSDPEALVGAKGADAGEALPSSDSIAPENIRWRLGSARFWMRTYWAVQDHRRQLAWARNVEMIGLRILDRTIHRAVISCGPWHLCNHEAARRLARRSRLPFIMDLRDPWSLERRLVESIATPVWFSLARHYEARAVREAALIVVNAEPVERAMQRRYPAVADRLVTITNGYDDDPMPVSRPGTRFTIAYAGGIYLDRDPRPLFQATARVVAALGLSPDAFAIELIGNVDDYGGVPIARMAEQEGIAAYVRTYPICARAEMLELLAGATMLLSLPQDSRWAVPSKIFEYMQFDAWLLVMAERDAPAALLLRGTQVDVVSPADLDGLARVLTSRYQQFARGERPVRLAGIERFSRRFQAQLLMEAIGKCLPAQQSRSHRGSEPRLIETRSDA